MKTSQERKKSEIDPLFIEDIVRMLDNTLDSFIKSAPSTMWRAVKSAQSERSIGLGTMGFHSYLQKSGIALQSPMSMGPNLKIFKHINNLTTTAFPESLETCFICSIDLVPFYFFRFSPMLNESFSH